MQVFLQFYVLFFISAILLLVPLKTALADNFLKLVLLLIVYTGIVRVLAEFNSHLSGFFSASVFAAHLLFTPGAYLYLRNQVFNTSIKKADGIHLLPFLVFFTGSIVANVIDGNNGFWLSRDWIVTDGFLNKSTAILDAFLFALAALYFSLILLVIKHKTLPITREVTMSHSGSLTISHNDMNGMSTDTFPVEVVSESTAALTQRTALLTDERIRQIDDVVTRFLQDKKPFLQQRYSLKDLSEETQIPLHQLSAYINKHCGKNFNDFINEYRVHYCKEKILNQECRNKKLEAVAEESGFNNRNTFAIAFKKVTGINPSQFLKKVKASEIEEPEAYEKPEALSFEKGVYCEA